MSGCIDPYFLALGTSWRSVASRTGRYTPGEKAFCTHGMVGWVNPRASLNGVEKILEPTETRTPALLSPSP
jgi:hypothetical protein